MNHGSIEKSSNQEKKNMHTTVLNKISRNFEKLDVYSTQGTVLSKEDESITRKRAFVDFLLFSQWTPISLSPRSMLLWYPGDDLMSVKTHSSCKPPLKTWVDDREYCLRLKQSYRTKFHCLFGDSRVLTLRRRRSILLRFVHVVLSLD